MLDIGGNSSLLKEEDEETLGDCAFVMMIQKTTFMNLKMVSLYTSHSFIEACYFYIGLEALFTLSTIH